jgi:hypothetical protein
MLEELLRLAVLAWLDKHPHDHTADWLDTGGAFAIAAERAYMEATRPQVSR